MKAPVKRYRQKSRSEPCQTPMHQFSSSSVSICLNFDFSICALVPNCELIYGEVASKNCSFPIKRFKKAFSQDIYGSAHCTKNCSEFEDISKKKLQRIKKIVKSLKNWHPQFTTA